MYKAKNSLSKYIKLSFCAGHTGANYRKLIFRELMTG